MDEVLTFDRLTDAISHEQSNLRRFIRKQVADDDDADDILQDVFSELVEAHHLMKPIEKVGAWLFQVARNRIVDLFRQRRPVSLQASSDDDALSLEDLLPALDGGPEAIYARSVLMDEIEAAVEELPPLQREVFVARNGRPQL